MHLREPQNASNVPDDNKQRKVNESLLTCIDGYENKNNSNNKKGSKREFTFHTHFFVTDRIFHGKKLMGLTFSEDTLNNVH